MSQKTFADFGLAEPIVRAVTESGYTTPTPIQAQSLPILLKGRDLLGCAQTGTGKTAAFALPILDHLAKQKRHVERKQVRALILSPTRELAVQIHDSFRTYGKHLRIKTAMVFGGVSQSLQVKACAQGVDVLVATPGRLLDLVKQRHIDLAHLQYFVLDEADRMLDMGFIGDIRKLAAMIPTKRHTLLFSATMPNEIRSLANSLLQNPERVEVAPVSSTAEKITQSVMFTERANKRKLLGRLLDDKRVEKVIVFTRTKHGANRLVELLKDGGVKSEAIHGNKSQAARQRALNDFRSSRLRVLVATDVMARGIDVDDVSHVINFDVPNEAESYVHRIGRTGRAGRTGTAITFCDPEERGFLRDIEKLLGYAVPVEQNHPFHSEAASNSRDSSHGLRGGQGKKRFGGGKGPRKQSAGPPRGKFKGSAPPGGGGGRKAGFKRNGHSTRPASSR